MPSTAPSPRPRRTRAGCLLATATAIVLLVAASALADHSEGPGNGEPRREKDNRQDKDDKDEDDDKDDDRDDPDRRTEMRARDGPRQTEGRSPLSADGRCDGPNELQLHADGAQHTLSWNATSEAQGYTVHRSTNGRPYETLIHLPATNTSYLDTEIVPDAVYRYQVTHDRTDAPSDACDSIEITAVPFFGAPTAAVAALGALAARRLAGRPRGG